MSSARAARTMSQKAPAAADVDVNTVGITAVEVDLFSVFSITDGLPAKFRVTYEADGEFYLLHGEETGFTAVTTGTGKRIPADSPRSWEIDAGSRFVSLIAAGAGTRVEITKG